MNSIEEYSAKKRADRVIELYNVLRKAGKPTEKMISTQELLDALVDTLPIIEDSLRQLSQGKKRGGGSAIWD